MALLASIRQPAQSWAAPTSAGDNTAVKLAPGYSQAVVLVDAMPRRFRPAVERAMAVCLRSDPVDAPFGADPLTADWCTRWVREARCNTHCDGEVTVGCKQPICAPTSELLQLRAMLGKLGKYGSFSARVEIQQD